MKLRLPDERAHQLVSEILDGAENRIVAKGLAEPESASDYLTAAYIRECEAFIEYVAVYLPNDERLAADMFLRSVATSKQARRLNARMCKKCALQLRDNTLMYFPNYHRILRLALTHISSVRTETREFLHSGVVMLAVGTLPGALTDIRRELRRRGFDNHRTLISENDLVSRMSNIEEQLRITRFSSYSS